MHIAASKPKAIDETGIDHALIESERRIAIEKAREAGKPDDKKTINDLLKAAKAEVATYVLYVVGEGLEKKSNDFAAEVAAQAAAAKQA